METPIDPVPTTGEAAQKAPPVIVEPDPAAFELTAQVPPEWKPVPLPDWLSRRGERFFSHAVERARLYRYVNVWEDGSTQEMWSIYVTSPEKPDAVCVSLELALSMHERFKRPGFMSKTNLLPWRT